MLKQKLRFTLPFSRLLSLSTIGATSNLDAASTSFHDRATTRLPETAFVSFLGQTFQFAAIHSEDLATKIRAVGGWKDMGWVGCQSARKRTNADSVQILSTD